MAALLLEELACQHESQGDGLENRRATVRLEPGNGVLATLIHEKVSNPLGIPAAKEAFFDGDAAEFPYAADLLTGVEAVERTVEARSWTVIVKEVHDEWARIDGRAEDSNPDRIAMERVNDRAFPLRITVIGGDGHSDLSKWRIDPMHDECDGQVGGHVK